LTLSTSPTLPPAVTADPAGFICTKVMSVSASAACWVIPMVTVPSDSVRNHSCVSLKRQLAGVGISFVS
jgi:hypothetical protein